MLLLRRGSYHHSSSIASTPSSASASASASPSPVPIMIPLPSSHTTFRRSNLVHLSPSSPPLPYGHGRRPRIASDTGVGNPLLSAVDLLPERSRTRSGSGSGRPPTTR